MPNLKERKQIEQAIAMLTAGELGKVRGILAGLLKTAVKPKPAAKPITSDPIMLRLGTWIRRFNPSNPKAVATGETTPCAVCHVPLKLARIVPFHVKGFGKWAHYACAPWIHSLDCACLLCRNRRMRAAKPLTFTGLTKMLPPQNLEQLLSQKKRVRGFGAQLNALKYCACSHDGPSHSEDELGNLLKCKVSHCDCDHFHYAADSQEKAA